MASAASVGSFLVGEGQALTQVTRFVNPLPLPTRIDATRGGKFKMEMREVSQNILGPGSPSTRVWGYGLAKTTATFPGPTFVAARDKPIEVTWQNMLYKGHFLPVDPTIHWALRKQYRTYADYARAGRPVPTVVHLHGGHTEPASDGEPEAWFTPDFDEVGPTFAKEDYYYENSQEAATLWYHDHALGVTRLNVYAGLAGFYLLRDDHELDLIRRNLIPNGRYEIELVIQDRMFDQNCQLFYPSAPPTPQSPTPSALPEFAGDVILVNGKAWPKLNVERRQYRFRLLNGSDSRFYHFWFETTDGVRVPFQQIGSDDGFLRSPVRSADLTFGPGERLDIVVDFSGLAGKRIIMRNDAAVPFSDGLDVLPSTDPTTQIMAFDVSTARQSDPVAVPTFLRSAPFRVPGNTSKTRGVLLFEGRDPLGRIQPLLGVVNDTASGKTGRRKFWDDPFTETPALGSTELWEIYNSTPDAHPVHLHMVAFEVVNRQSIVFDAYDPTDPNATVNNIRPVGSPESPRPNETGPKDTVQAFPGQVTRVRANFDRPGRYVWHCHILSHEDHEMMRPYRVGAGDGTPRDIKSALLLALKRRIGSVRDKSDQEAMAKAIGSIEDSLDRSYWAADGSHLDPKDGKKVFDKEGDAVKTFEKILKDKKTTIPIAEVEAWASTLAMVDRDLAQIALDDAGQSAGSSKDLLKAFDSLQKGDDALADPDYTKAIDGYQKAWEGAQKAVK